MDGDSGDNGWGEVYTEIGICGVNIKSGQYGLFFYTLHS